MKRFLKYAVRSLIGILLIFGVLFVISGDFRKEILGVVSDWILISKDQTSHPISKEKAEKYFRAGYLPVSAHDIQYASAGCYVTPAFETFIRFEAPVQDCLVHARLKYPDIELKPISSVYQQAATWVTADWFDTGKIKHGLEGSKVGVGATIWVDTDRGIFYFYDSD